jgi:hypothetical protein
MFLTFHHFVEVTLNFFPSLFTLYHSHPNTLSPSSTSKPGNTQCLGRVHLCLLDYRHAQESFLVALQQDPSDTVSLFLLAIVCFELGEMEQSVEKLQRLLGTLVQMRGIISTNTSEYFVIVSIFDTHTKLLRSRVSAMHLPCFKRIVKIMSQPLFLRPYLSSDIGPNQTPSPSTWRAISCAGGFTCTTGSTSRHTITLIARYASDVRCDE